MVGPPGFQNWQKRMKTKPTRFTGWAGKNLAESLATRRRRSTTSHGTGDAGKKHVVRIEAPAASVKRPVLAEFQSQTVQNFGVIPTGAAFQA
jgi:hypothetical protein